MSQETAVGRAESLFSELVKAKACVTYGHAYHRIFQNEDRPQRWTHEHTRQVIAAAMHTQPRELKSSQQVGGDRMTVRLDALIVSAESKMPGRGHFRFASYTPHDWRQFFSGWTLWDRLR